MSAKNTDGKWRLGVTGCRNAAASGTSRRSGHVTGGEVSEQAGDNGTGSTARPVAVYHELLSQRTGQRAQVAGEQQRIGARLHPAAAQAAVYDVARIPLDRLEGEAACDDHLFVVAVSGDGDVLARGPQPGGEG